MAERREGRQCRGDGLFPSPPPYLVPCEKAAKPSPVLAWLSGRRVCGPAPRAQVLCRACARHRKEDCSAEPAVSGRPLLVSQALVGSAACPVQQVGSRRGQGSPDHWCQRPGSGSPKGRVSAVRGRRAGEGAFLSLHSLLPADGTHRAISAICPQPIIQSPSCTECLTALIVGRADY